jgi:hypothetical protein
MQTFNEKLEIWEWKEERKRCLEQEAREVIEEQRERDEDE